MCLCVIGLRTRCSVVKYKVGFKKCHVILILSENFTTYAFVRMQCVIVLIWYSYCLMVVIITYPMYHSFCYEIPKHATIPQPTLSLTLLMFFSISHLTMTSRLDDVPHCLGMQNLPDSAFSFVSFPGEKLYLVYRVTHQYLSSNVSFTFNKCSAPIPPL